MNFISSFLKYQMHIREHAGHSHTCEASQYWVQVKCWVWEIHIE